MTRKSNQIPKMNIYLLQTEDYDYDDYIGFVVTAKNRKNAIKIAKEIGDDDYSRFTPEIIKKIGETTRIKKEMVILESYNAG